MTEQPKKSNKQTHPQKPNPSKKPKGSVVMYIIYAVIILALGGMLLGGGDSSSPKNIKWEKLERILVKGDYEKIVVVNQEYAEIHIKKEALKNPDYKDLFGTTLVGQPSPEASFYKYNIGNFEHLRRM